MILYLDTSALAKRYIKESSSDDVRRWMVRADIIAVSLLAYPEANAAFARAVRTKSVSKRVGDQAAGILSAHWPTFVKLPVSESITVRAAELAWTLGLRGYDAVHLASAENWQSTIGTPIVLMTYDRQQAIAAQQLGLKVLPELT